MADTYYRTFHPNYIGIGVAVAVLVAMAFVLVYAIRRRTAGR
jgi:ABC-type antimicrobial peptide transport system permease subunit